MVDEVFVDYPIADAASDLLARVDSDRSTTSESPCGDTNAVGENVEISMNRSRALELMRQHGVAAIVGATPDNVCYMTGHNGWAQYVYATLPCVAAFTDDGTEGTDLIVPRATLHTSPLCRARPK